MQRGSRMEELFLVPVVSRAQKRILKKTLVWNFNENEHEVFLGRPIFIS